MNETTTGKPNNETTLTPEALEERFRTIREFQQQTADDEEKSLGRTFCGLNYGNNSCRFCMYEQRCAARQRRIQAAAWHNQMNAFRTMTELEEQVRQRLGGLEGSAREPFLFLLAKILRAQAVNPVMQSRGDRSRAEEAGRIFEELYYGTGDPAYREEAESCRLLAGRMNEGQKVSF